MTTQETITLGGGCFWCLEAVFDDVIGVTDVVSGYCNGHVKNPSYRDVCTGSTGHAEVVRVTFEPSQLSLRSLLEIFFTIHDPTSLNRQGADVGTQYRSGIYFHSEEQAAVARELINELNLSGTYGKPIVTEVVAVDNFSVAENYHQEYFINNSYQPYCQAVIVPKINKFRKSFANRVK